MNHNEKLDRIQAELENKVREFTIPHLSIRIDPDTIYSVKTLESLFGPRFVQRVRPCAFANGQWVGKSILQYLARIGRENSKVKPREPKQENLSPRTKQLQDAIWSYKNPATLKRKGGNNGNQKDKADRAGNNSTKPAG